MGIVNVESRTFERMLTRFEDALNPNAWQGEQAGPFAAGAVAGQPAGLPAAEHLQTDVADPSRQRVSLLHADQPQDLLPGRRCTVVPCGAGSATQARAEAQKRGINGGVRIVALVVVSGRISHQTDGKWAMN